MSTSVSSILDDSHRYKAQVVKGFLQTGQVNVTIVPELVKLHNNVLLMKILANVLGITEANKQKYNLQSIRKLSKCTRLATMLLFTCGVPLQSPCCCFHVFVKWCQVAYPCIHHVVVYMCLLNGG